MAAVQVHRIQPQAYSNDKYSAMVHEMLSNFQLPLQSLRRGTLQELVVQKLINTNPGLQVNYCFNFCYYFFLGYFFAD